MALRILAGLLFCSGVVTWYGWRLDNIALRGAARAITVHSRSDAETVRALTEWVYRARGFAKNKRSHVIPQLGPTPMQIFDGGGDCADKSRLLAVMLDEVGIPSGLVMVYPCADCPSIHTVVEARTKHGRMIADPVWGVTYPGGVRDLAGTRIGIEHVAQLKTVAASSDKIHRMPDAEADFTHARAMGRGPQLDVRPRILEDPKLALWVLFVVAGLGFTIVAALFLGSVAKEAKQQAQDWAWISISATRLAGRTSSKFGRRAA
jgi:hypothetical protein